LRRRIIDPMARDLPSGRVTFLFTDVEGSTKLLHQLGAEGYAQAPADHRRILREAFTVCGGVEVDTQGDAIFVAFPTAPGALQAAREAQHALAKGAIRVRMGLHTGTPHLAGEGYVGVDVHRAARIAAAGHGGQILISGATASLVETHGLRELGEHRLKDFDQPVPLFQFGDDDFPPLNTISNTNLPRPTSSFVGREKDVAEVASLLQDGARLLTLTGPGGSGKTRLAIEAAAELVPEFNAGVFWVGLAPLRDPALVPDTIGHTLGAKDSLTEHIGEREILVLLDNFEQVVASAPELANLLEACPNLRLLVTSRELLRVRGEVSYPVLPLADTDAVHLFCTRAQLEPDEVSADLCRRLDNLPLALELAAARTSVLAPIQILERLSKRLDLLKGGRDAEARQQTLRSTLEWSYDLLEEGEKRLFVRLSVFAGGCALEAAEQVAEADLDVLQSLVDKSLLRHGDERFWMLETIREYAAERLDESEEADEAAIRGRHLDFFFALAERAYEERLTSTSMWFPVLDDELDNMRAALDWAHISNPKVAVQLAGAMAYYWFLKGREAEARDRVAGALAGYESRDRIRARALTYLGQIESMERDKALFHLNEALDLWREHGDVLGEALALERIGDAHLYAGDYGPARLAFERSLALRKGAGAPELEGAGALGGLSQLLVAAGEIERVEPLAQQLYELGKRYGNLDTQADALHYLADCPLIGGDYEEAEKRYLRALAHACRSGVGSPCPTQLIGVAMSAAGRGDHARAVRLATAAAAQREALGRTPVSPTHWWSRLQERHIGGARAQLSSHELEEAEHAGRQAVFDDVLDEVLGAETAPPG
jgi:predicted ATPase/class 3 adenylate cyclase